MDQQRQPLAERMRPKQLDEIAGQRHLLDEGKPLRVIAESDFLPSLIFWGPPGVGKTTLSRILADHFSLPFYAISAIEAGVKEVRQLIDMARKQGKIVLFIDEIHRFNKAQQDALLGAVERGQLVLIGATTENPSFEVIPALLSRCQVYVLEHLEVDELKALAENALATDEYLRQRKIKLEEWDLLLRHSGGDARRLLNTIELVCASKPMGALEITNEMVQKVLQTTAARYDKSGEQHYDIISAFIKSIRGSDPNAALYWLSRMIEGGEDPKFIARRLLILASEDIGNANPTAFVLANNCFQAVQFIGYPECRLTLAQATLYLASSPKSNSVYTAIKAAQKAVTDTGDLEVPLHLRNAPTELMKSLDYGKAYQYAHDFPGNFVELEFLPEGLNQTDFYQPGENAREREMRKYLRACWKGKYGF